MTARYGVALVTLLVVGAGGVSPDVKKGPRLSCREASADEEEQKEEGGFPNYRVGCNAVASFSLNAPEKPFRAKITITDRCFNKSAPTPSKLFVNEPQPEGGYKRTQVCVVDDGKTKTCEISLPAGKETELMFQCNGAGKKPSADDDDSDEPPPGCGYMLGDVP